jgi:hypothetical protein
MRALGRIDFLEGPDGGVHVEVVTREPAREVHASWGQTYTLAEDVRNGGGVLIDTSGVPDHPHSDWSDLPVGWRYLGLRTKVEAGPTGRYVTRQFDLSEGSDDRRVAAALVAQGAVRVVWVNERLEAVRELDDTVRTAWTEALANTRGVTREAWQEELAELNWRHSPSWRPGRPRPRKYKRRTAVPPARPVPWFARRSGVIPRAGTPTVAGVTLPRGSRCPSLGAAYWATDEPAADATHLAARLVGAFPDTGLWPLLWAWEEDPENYLGGHGDVDAIDRADPHQVIETLWKERGADPELTQLFGGSFPGLAEGSPPPSPAADVLFRVLAEPEPGAGAGRRMLLVPCNRPGDALTAFGFQGTTVVAPQICAVLRSWEERFAAVPVAMNPSTMTFAVGAPPTTADQALRLAAEIQAIAPLNDSSHPDRIRNLAHVLLTGRPDEHGWQPDLRISRGVWELAFAE